MSNPVESYLKEFKQQSSDTTTSDPVDDYLKSYQPHLAVGQPVPDVPPEQGSMIGDIGRGVLRTGKEVVEGTAQFAADAGRSLQQPHVTYDRATGQVTAEPVQPTTSGLELLKQAVLAPPEMIYHGAQEALSPESTVEQRAHGASTAAAGALGAIGGLKGIAETAGKIRGEPVKGPIERIQASKAAADQAVTTPPAGGSAFANARTPEERQALVDQLSKQAEATAAAQQSAKIQLMKAVNAWNTLTTEQRSVVVKGLAVTDYTKTWKDLGKDARNTIKQSLGVESGTNLDTSTQAEAPPPAAPVEVVAPSAEAPAVSTGAVPPEAPAPQLPEAAKHVAQDVQFMDLPTLRDELARADGKLSDLTIQESMGTDVTKRGLAPEREFWEKYSEDLKNEMAARLNPSRAKGGSEALFQKIDETTDLGPVAPAEPPFNGQRFVHPDMPDRSAVLSRNTKPGEKPWRVSYFKTDAKGEVQTYLHNTFDTPKEAYDFVTGKGDERAGGSADKLRGYVEQQTKPNAASSFDETPPIAVDDRVTTRDGNAGKIESIQGNRAVVQFDNGDLVNISMAELNRETPSTPEPNPPASPEPLAAGSEAPQGAPSAEGAPLTIEPLDPARLDAINQSIEDKLAAEKLVDQKPITNPEAIRNATPQQLDDLIDDIDKSFEIGEISQEQHARGLFEIAEAKRAWKAQNVGPAPVTPASKFKMPDTLGKDLNKFSNDQLSNVKKSIGALLRSPDIAKLPEANVLRQELDRIFDYESQIRKAAEEGPRGPGLAVKKIDVEGRPPFEQYFAKKIVLEPDLKSPWNFIKFARKMYQGFVRPSHALNVADRLYEGATGEKLQTHEASGKLMEMMDGSMTQAETFLRGDGPFVPGPNGEFVKAGAKSLADIVVNTAHGDVERLGWLWAARRALELKALRNKNIGVDLGYAQELVVNSSRELHQAVDEARAYHSALSLFSQIRGLISPEARAAFEQETSYGPIQRMFGPQEVVSKVAQTINNTGRTAETIMASDEFKRLKGSDLLIRNMVESSIDVTHRILRAAKINEVASALVDKAIAQPDLYKGMIDRFEHREHLQVMRDITARASAVKALFKESGIDVSPEHANLFANLLSDNAMDVKGGKLLVWRGGKIEAWKVDELTAASLKSLTPTEMPTWVKAMGLPARGARIGIVLDPMFMFGQILNDQFQGWFNTKYGFTPLLDTFKGWWNIVHNTEAFKEAMRAGGLEKSSLRGRTTLADIIAGPNLKPGELAFKQIMTVHPFKALQTIVTPLREATRMGEYLQARGHGATPVEAAFAARDLLGNYSLQGTFATVRALNHMSLFLGPAIAVTDKTFRTIKEQPVKWFTRATTLAGISTLLYLANKDDEEIQNLRQTPGGQRWWFFRMGVGPDAPIAKIRKPYLEGAIFASGIEAFLDEQNGSNPDAMKLWGQAQLQELTLNMLPVMGVIPAELWANKDTYSGAPIIPEGQQGLDPQFQTGYYSGSAERIVGKAAGISPAILSYVVRGTGGYLGESGVKAVSAAIDWANTGELPPVEDFPLTQRAFAKYPSYSVKPVQDFYKLAQKVDQASKTISYASQHSPDDVGDVLLAHEKELPLIELFNQSRQQIADLRRAITSVEDLKDLGPTSKKLYTDEYLRSIIEISKATVEVAQGMQDETSTPAPTPSR